MRLSEIRSRLSTFAVGIAGAGGLGSNCAVAIARSGIGKLIICDYDIVERVNLNRQYYFSDQIGMKKVYALKDNIARIDGTVTVEAHDIQLEPGSIVNIFKECDIIVEAFDQAEMKQMLAETVLERLPGKPLIMGSGMAGWGDNNSISEKSPGDDIYICGDDISEVSDDNPPLAPRVCIVANMQANIVLELLLKKSVGNENNIE